MLSAFSKVMREVKVLVVGGGCAGYTAAIYSGRAALETVVFEGSARGGQLATAADVDNYPGFKATINGSWLMDQMRLQASGCAELIPDVVLSIARRDDGKFLVGTDSSGDFLASAVILASGAYANWLGLESEERYKNKGVSACATCDGFFFKGKRVAVVGGGNVAVSEALFLSNLASSVTLIHRRDELRAEKTMQALLLAEANKANSKIKLIWSHVVEEVLGDSKHVTGLRIRPTMGGDSSDIEVDGLFVAIGHTPNSSLVKGLVNLDEHGYVITEPGSSKTNILGLFAAGDVQDSVYRQAATSVGSGCMAGMDAEKYLLGMFN